MTPPALRRPFLHGILLGVALPLLAILVPTVTGGLDRYLSRGAILALMPVFIVLGLPAFLVTRRLRVVYERMGARALHLTHGLLAGGWVAGSILLWVSFAELSLLRRLGAASAGGVMLVGFWLWIGSLLAHAGAADESGPAGQSQDISSRPK